MSFNETNMMGKSCDSFEFSNLKRYTYFALKANAVQILTFVPLSPGLTLETLHQLQIPFAKLIGL